ncbi:hypothetical protein Taro_038380, partial [Colocasia esculenta]|nr:hypothetical protein [Colocasia esculenta]
IFLKEIFSNPFTSPLSLQLGQHVKLIDKPFPYKQQMDILCGKTTVRGSHFLGSNQDVDVESQRSFGDGSIVVQLEDKN